VLSLVAAGGMIGWFLSYVNHRNDMIYLAGFPYIPSSMPYSEGGVVK